MRRPGVGAPACHRLVVPDVEGLGTGDRQLGVAEAEGQVSTENQYRKPVPNPVFSRGTPSTIGPRLLPNACRIRWAKQTKGESQCWSLRGSSRSLRRASPASVLAASPPRPPLPCPAQAPSQFRSCP